MKTLNLPQKPLDIRDYKFRAAKDSDYQTLIDKPCIIHNESGEPKIIYDIIPATQLTDLLNAIRTIKMKDDWRTTGLHSISRVFGYSPRVIRKHDYCATTGLAFDAPAQHRTICKFAKTLRDYYSKHAPAQFKEHKQLVNQKILKDWTLEGTPFTSGIVNYNNQLHYHRDTGNIPNMYSNMIGLTHNIVGGNLAIPEFDIGLKITNGSLVIFDGQKIIHGVTKITKTSRTAYRYTIVYYSMQKMWKCLTPQEELARYKRVRTDRTESRRKRLTGEIPNSVRQ